MIARLLTTSQREHFNRSIMILKYQEIEGEQARAYRMKAIAMRRKGNLTEAEQLEADDAETLSRSLRRKYFEDKEEQLKGLTDDQQYDLLLCGQRR